MRCKILEQGSFLSTAPHVFCSRPSLSVRSPTPQRLNLQPFPPYLRELCFTDLATYCRVFSNASTDADSLLVQEGECQVEMSGNWSVVPRAVIARTSLAYG